MCLTFPSVKSLHFSYVSLYAGDATLNRIFPGIGGPLLPWDAQWSRKLKKVEHWVYSPSSLLRLVCTDRNATVFISRLKFEVFAVPSSCLSSEWSRDRSAVFATSHLTDGDITEHYLSMCRYTWTDKSTESKTNLSVNTGGKLVCYPAESTFAAWLGLFSSGKTF